MRKTPWSQKEIADLEQFYSHDTPPDPTELTSHFGRTLRAIESKAQRLGVATHGNKPWTQEDDDMLCSMYTSEPRVPITEMSSKLDRTKSAIVYRARKLGVAGHLPQNRSPWSDDDNRFLTTNFHSLTMKQLVHSLGRSESAILSQAKRLGIELKMKPQHWTKKDIDILTKLYPTTTSEELAPILNRTPGAIRRAAKYRNITAERHLHRQSHIPDPSFNPYELVDPVDLAYIAGIIDGEGTIRIFKRRGANRSPEVHITIGNTNLDLIHYLESTIIGSTFRTSRPAGTRTSTGITSTKTLYTWHLSSTVRSRHLLSVTVPYLIIKKDRAVEALGVTTMYDPPSP